MKKELQALRAGVIDFAGFVRATSLEWTKLAEHLHGRYAVPAGVGAEDIAQEMLVAAWAAARDWDPASTMTLEGYVTWCAYASAKKWVHGQRNSLRRDDKAPGRFPLPFAAYSDADRDAEQMFARLMVVPSGVEERVLLVELIAALETEGHRIAISALASSGGDVQGAAELLLGDARIRVALRLWSTRDASRLVRDAIAASRLVVNQEAA